MSKIYYSPASKGFYRSDRHNKIPGDAIEITAEKHRELLEAPMLKKQIVIDADGQPVLADPPAMPLDQLAVRQRAAIDTARDAAFSAGMTYDFPDGTTDAVQTRPEDKANLLGIAIEARDLRDAGITEPVIEFRGASNETHALTADQAITMTNAALAHIKAIYEQSWQRKDAIAAALAAEDREGIEAVVW